MFIFTPPNSSSIRLFSKRAKRGRCSEFLSLCCSAQFTAIVEFACALESTDQALSSSPSLLSLTHNPTNKSVSLRKSRFADELKCNKLHDSQYYFCRCFILFFFLSVNRFLVNSVEEIYAIY